MTLMSYQLIILCIQCRSYFFFVSGMSDTHSLYDPYKFLCQWWTYLILINDVKLCVGDSYAVCKLFSTSGSQSGIL